MGQEFNERTKPSPEDLVVYQVVIDHFKQDTREFWTRANFFLVAHAGLFSAFVVAYPGMAGRSNLMSLSIPLLGLGTAIIWFIVLKGAISFLQSWREQVIRLDKEIDRFQCYVEVESLAKRNPLSSPSYVTQFLPLFFIATWLGILVSILWTLY
ncbi:hypothetical protein A3K78_09340 [Candidatus Bathyarchaeota archaeon RBG_13_52_12]|nr:MAG: hypothetical protein A3K78_09340 [Candidatus Bathyarchaeota archaeon RBG_13_52_12]